MVRTNTVLWVALCLSVGYFLVGPITERFVIPRVKYYINTQIEEHMAAESLNLPAPAPKETGLIDGFDISRPPAP